MLESINPIITSLENAPNILLPLIGEIPNEIIKRRPVPGKWSAHEHAAHLTQTDSIFINRLNLMLTEENPVIKSYLPDKDEEDGAFLKIDLAPALEKFARERKTLVEKLKTLSAEDWQRTARHEEYTHYSVFIMFRHLALHDNLHSYRIEEILLSKEM